MVWRIAEDTYMKIAVRAILSCALLLAGCAKGTGPEIAAQAGDFFRPGPVAPDKLPAQGIFPQGRIMHIGGYSPVSAPVKQLGGIIPLDLAKQSGFTVAGPYYGPFARSKETMERAAALGMHVAAQLEVPPVLQFNKDEDPLKLRGARMAALPEPELRRWVQEDMNNFLKNSELNRAVSCWAIAPEELRHWRKPELDYEQAYLKAVNDFDPQHRPAFMYELNNRDTASLLKTGPGQGFVLEGAYVHGYGWDVRRSLRINWAMDQMTGAAAKDGRAVVPGLELSRNMPGFTAKDLEADPAARARLRRLLRHDVYLAIVRGAQGVQVWSLFHSRKSMTTYLELMKGYGEVLREMSPPVNLQEPILFGERRQDLALEVVEGPAFIAAPAQDATLAAVEGKINVAKDRWPSARLANIAYGHERVLILVNSADQPVRVRLAGMPVAAHLTTVSGGDAAKMERIGSALQAALEPFAALVLRVDAKPVQ
jgi:hypothetical protein